MKEFNLTQPYVSLEEMMNSGEVAVYKEELQQGNIEKYAIVSRIGNRYDLDGNRIEDFTNNPFLKKEEASVVYKEAIEEKVIEKEILEVKDMKYFEIEKLIDAEVEKAIAEVKNAHEAEIANLKEIHAQELCNAKAEARAELIAKLND